MKGRQHVNHLSQLLAEIQRDAADLPTGKLRTEIQVSLDVLAAFIDTFQNLPAGPVSLEDMISATGDVITAALITALYVRELTERPADRFAQVRLSFN
jgi:hypothetical protein